MRLRFLSLFIALAKHRLENRIKCISTHHHLGKGFLIVNETNSGHDTRFFENDTETIKNGDLENPRSNFVKRGILNNLLDDKINMHKKLILIDQYDIFNK